MSPTVSPTPAVSVVIPTQNRCRRLALALRTALGQQDVDHEVIVVDDGSQDDTPEYLASHADGRIHIIRHEQVRGLAAARNSGIAAARGRWIAFLDDDDLWAPDKLATQVRVITERPETGWCAVGSVTVDRELRITGGKRTPEPEAAAYLVRTENPIPGGGSGVMAEASLLREVGGFDPRFSLAADWELWIRLAERSALACVDRPLVGYVLHGANLSTAARGYDAELLALVDKYRNAPSPVHAEIPRAALAARAGHRLEAVGLLLRAGLRYRARQSFVRATVIAAGPFVERAARRWQPRLLPASWHVEAGRWLADLRAELPAEHGVML